VLENLPALVSKIELEPSLHDLDEPRELHRARTGPGFASTTPEHSAVKRRAAPESEAGLEAVFGPDRTIRLCHVRRVAIVALSGRPGTQCIRRVCVCVCDARTPLVVTRVHAFIRYLSHEPRGDRAPACLIRALNASEPHSWREVLGVPDPSIRARDVT
jgi:hypothetical protein